MTPRRPIDWQSVGDAALLVWGLLVWFLYAYVGACVAGILIAFLSALAAL